MHPAAPHLFLVAYDMGYLAVFVARRRYAASVLSCPTPVVAGIWLPGRRDQCAVVTTCGHIAVFHITSGDLKPHKEYKVKLSEGVECTSVTASAWRHSGVSMGKENAGKDTALPGHEQNVLVLGLSTGACIYHVIGEVQEKNIVLWTADTLVERLLGGA